MEVKPVAVLTMYVMLKAIPVQGALAHSLAGPLSLVETSTIPAPFTVPRVQDPVTLMPLMQIRVDEGDLIKGPSVALMGLRIVLSTFT